MLVVKMEDQPSLIAKIEPRNQTIFAKISPITDSLKAVFTPGNLQLRAIIEQHVELEPYFETGNEAGGTTIIIGE